MDRADISASRILIVDDQNANVLLLQRVLQHAGYKNYQAITDSCQFLDAFRTFQPDLILLDLMMPKMDGYAVIKQLNGWVPDGVYLPILVITADMSRTARQKALSLGAKDFLAKPIDTTEATLRINNLLITRLLYRQLVGRNGCRVSQASSSKERVDSALKKLECVAAQGQVLANDLKYVRSELMLAAALLERLLDDASADLRSDPFSSAPALAEATCDAPSDRRV